MDHKINKPAVHSHIKNVAFDLASSLYEEKEVLTGKEILMATEIQQVNFFVLKILFNNWKREMKNIRSPYFNYDAPEVKEAVKKLGEVLSFQISVKKEDFVALLEKAFEQYVDYLKSPYQFMLDNFLPQTESRLQVHDLAENIKYFKINNSFVKAVIDKLNAIKLNELSYDDGKACIMEVYDQLQGDLEKSDVYLQELKDLYNFPLDVETNTTEDKTSEPEMEEEEATPEPEILENEEPVESMEDSTNSQEDHLEDNEQRVFEFDYTKKSNATLNDLYADYSKTEKLNDRLKLEKEDKSILHRHQMTKIDSLLNSIAINQKYHFINALFHGDPSAYEETMKILDASETKDEASRLIAVDFTEKFGWDDSKDPDVSKLLQLVERRF